MMSLFLGSFKQIYDNNLIENKNHFSNEIVSPIENKKLPFEAMPTYNLVKEDGEYFPSYTIFTLMDGDNDYQVIMDEDGNYETLPFGSSWETTILNSTSILYHGWASSYIYNIYTEEMVRIDAGGHHEVEYNPLNDSFFGFLPDKHTIDGILYRFDIIQEFNRKGEVIWSLDFYDFISHTWWNGQRDHESIRDVVHPNSIFFDSEEKSLYVNSRNLDTCWKINYTTKEIIWGLGKYGNLDLYDLNGIAQDNLFYHAHALELIDDNHFIIFDNDWYNDTYTGKYYSRILEFKVNESAMEAYETWEWVAPPAYSSLWWSDADRLPNGNRFGTFGPVACLIEVNDEKEIVWKLDLNSGGIYRAERFRYSPIIKSQLKNYTEIPNHYGNDSYTFTWQTWYNFRQKYDVIGDYYLYLDNTLIANNSHQFERFWQDSNITVQINNLDPGNHTFLLKVGDEAGHYTEHELHFSLAEEDISLTRQFPKNIELNRYQNISWSYNSYYPLNCSVFVNGSKTTEFSHQNQEIFLNIENWTLGTYNVCIYLDDNQNDIEFSKEFLISIHPQNAPKIEPLYEDQIVVQFNSTVLNWQISDLSPKSWNITLNDQLILNDDWDQQSDSISYDISNLDLGTHNFSFNLMDYFGLTNENSFQVQIVSSNYPYIFSNDTDFYIKWGTEQASLNWNVENGQNWKMWRDDELFDWGDVLNNKIIFNITDWQLNNWMLDNYKIKLQVFNDENRSYDIEFNLTIFYELGDAYANSIIASESNWYYNGENALGAPDNTCASIVYDYSAGQISFDMGELEKIVNGEGSDFEVISSQGEYSVYVGNSLAQPFTNIGSGTGNNEFDLGVEAISEARYVQIRYLSGDSVEIDAIKALNYEEHPGDVFAPEIEELSNLQIYINHSSTLLMWEVDDLTPWSYQLTINSTMVQEGPWLGDNIHYNFNYTTPGTYIVHLELTDLIGNKAFSEITIQVIDPNASKTPSERSISGYNQLMLIGLAIIILELIKKEKYQR